MDWVGPRKMAPMEALNFQGSPCLTKESAWNALHSSFNSASGRPVELDAFSTSMPPRDKRPWRPFSLAELKEALAPCSGRSAPGPDHLTWWHLKVLVANETVSHVFLWVANACLSAGIWPEEFKASRTVVIPKPGKPAYDTPKAFQIGRAHV